MSIRKLFNVFQIYYAVVQANAILIMKRIPYETDEGRPSGRTIDMQPGPLLIIKYI